MKAEWLDAPLALCDLAVSNMYNTKNFLNYTRTPTHISHKIFVENYADIHKIKPVLMLSKLIYVGFTVLELSKWLMYDFHCNLTKKHFYAELLFIDTDSLAYDIKSEGVNEEFF